VLGAVARHHEGIEAWPVDHLVPGLVAGAVVAGVTVLMVTGRARLPAVPVAAVGVAALVVTAVAGGWLVQRHYLDHRYLDAGHRLDEVYAEFRDVHDSRVAVFGESERYPLFGLDLSNRVVTLPGPAAATGPRRCRAWQQTLDEGRYRYLVVTANRLLAEQSPQPWVAGDPAVTVLVRDGDTVVYEIDGTLDPDRCRDT